MKNDRARADGSGSSFFLLPSSITVVRRHRLIAQLHELIHHRLTMVVAPAGYGKTTLLADFAAACEASNLPLSVCWYTATPWDTAGVVVLAGIATAVRARFDTFGERTLRLLSEARAGASPSEGEPLISSAVGMLASELQEDVPDYTLLVLDDYHLLDDNPSARVALELLLDRLPDHVRVTLLSRTVPALDTSRLALADQLGGLGPRDLAFTDEELGLLLRQRYQIEPGAELLSELRRRTEGWVAGVILAMPSPDEVASTDRAAALVSNLSEGWARSERLHQYLAAQLWQRQSGSDQELLLAAALPDVCDARELDQALVRTDSHASLGRLERAGLPLARLDPAGERYRMHALLQQFLRAHLAQTDRRRHAELCRAWGQLGEARGDHTAAMAHYLAGRHHDRAARVLERFGERWIDSGRHQQIERWLVELPPSLLDKRPRLCLCAARLAMVQGRRTLAVERARQAGFVARRTRDSVAAARGLLLEAMAILGTGHTEEALRLCLQALEHQTVRRSKPLLAEAYRSLSIAEAMRGLSGPAQEHMEQALALYEEIGEPWHVAVALNNLGVAYERLGQADRAFWCHSRALALRRDLGDLEGTGRSLNNLGLLHYYRAAYAEAETLFLESLHVAEQTGNLRSLAARYVNLGDLRRVQRRTVEALASYHAALDAAIACHDPQLQAYALVGEAAGHLLAGDLPGGEQSARQALHLAEHAGYLEAGGHAGAVLAAVALAAGRPRQAGALLDAARQAAQETGSKPLQVRVFLWSGYAAHRQRRWGEAIACVQVAAEAAAALGGPALLSLEGPAMVPLLRTAASKGIATDLLARALDDLDAAAAAAAREVAAPPAAHAALPPITLQLLGRFILSVGGRPPADEAPSRGRVRELLAYFALHPEGRRREQLAADLWPDAEPGQDVTLTHTTLHRLRQATFPEIVVGDTVHGGTYRIHPNIQLEVDVHRFQRLLKAADRLSASADERKQLLTKVVAAYSGPFLPECYSEWAGTMRLHLERLYTNALAQLVDADWVAGDYRACLKSCERLLDFELAEDAIHCRVLECYERLSEPLAGVLHYQRYARQLGDEYHGRPSSRAAAIHQRLQEAVSAAG